MSAGSISRKRIKLYVSQNGKCHWCGERMDIWWDHEPGKPLPSDAATLDHLWHSCDPRRVPGQPGPVVLACYACNQERGTLDDLRWRGCLAKGSFAAVIQQLQAA